MAKKKTESKPVAKPASTSKNSKPKARKVPEIPPFGESREYFTKFLTKNKTLLKKRGNQEIFKKWLADHPEFDSIPWDVAQALGAVKFHLRKELNIHDVANRKRKEGKSSIHTGKSSGVSIQSLEKLIDECILVAVDVDRDDFDPIIHHLRYALKQVIKHGKN